MSYRHVFLCAALLVLLAGGQAWSAQSTADVPITDKAIAEARALVGSSQASVPLENEYIIGQGDVLSVQVFGEGEMSAANVTAEREDKKENTDVLRGGVGAQVRIDGRISLKHIGDIDAVGYTLTQLADYLKKLYSSVYDDPIVTVVLVQSNSKRYTVMGKVAKPGVYYLDYPINLVQVVARCGGFSEWAKSKIKLVRNPPDKNGELFDGNTLNFDYGDFLDGKGLEKNVLIKAGDIIIVN